MGSAHDQAAVDALVALVLELRPSLPPSIAESLVREALDDAADAVLDVEWARIRERLYPAALASAHTRHTLLPYVERRCRELAAAGPRPGDFPGRRFEAVA